MLKRWVSEMSKHIIAAAIDQLIRFDSHDEMLKYIIKLKGSRKKNSTKS